MAKNISRCQWVTQDPLYISYHDEEWGKPIYDDSKLFEFLILEGAQAGLSWITILKKRAAYRQAFDNFNPVLLAKFSKRDMGQLLKNPNIVRNRLKIEAAINNAKVLLNLLESQDSFSDYLWQFVDGKPKINHWRRHEQVPVSTEESQAMSKALKKQGFKFVGPTICYAFMQAVGMVNDHLINCFRWRELT